MADLTPGDKIYFRNIDGESKIYIVQKILFYNKDDQVPEIFYADDNKSHLNLITCAGSWDDISKSYPKRLVVFSDRE